MSIVIPAMPAAGWRKSRDPFGTGIHVFGVFKDGCPTLAGMTVPIFELGDHERKRRLQLGWGEWIDERGLAAARTCSK